MYMDLRPEVAHQIHSSLCGGTDRLPSRKSSSDGAPGSQQRENIPMNGQQLGGLPPKPGRGGGGGMASQQGDIELGMGGMIRRPPSSLASGRLSSISEDTSLDSSDGRRQTLQHLPEVTQNWSHVKTCTHNDFIQQRSLIPLGCCALLGC